MFLDSNNMTIYSKEGRNVKRDSPEESAFADFEYETDCSGCSQVKMCRPYWDTEMEPQLITKLCSDCAHGSQDIYQQAAWRPGMPDIR
jgi:hypothetical protein